MPGARRAQRRAHRDQSRGGRAVLRDRVAPATGRDAKRRAILSPYRPLSPCARLASRRAAGGGAHRVRCRRPGGVDALHRSVVRRAARRARPGSLSGGGGGYGFGCKDPTAATSPSCATAPITPTLPTNPTGRAGSFTSISTRATSRRASPSSPRRSASPRRRKRAAVVPCIAPTPTIARSCSPRPTLATLNHIAFVLPEFDSVMRGMGA